MRKKEEQRKQSHGKDNACERRLRFSTAVRRIQTNRAHAPESEKPKKKQNEQKQRIAAGTYGLFAAEQVFVVELLELLVAPVDEELLQVVGLELLEAEDVQDTDHAQLLLLGVRLAG